MDLSGVIFVLLALAWAGYLIPRALRHHDEVARTRSIDRFSTALRVLARREPVDHSDSRLVVTPDRRAAARTTAPTPSPEPAAVSSTRVSVAPAVPRARLETHRRAARAAARRRRRILAVLLLACGGVGAAVYLGRLPGWSPAVPGGLMLAFLVLCRVLVRRESRRDVRVLTGPAPTSTPAVTDEVVDEHRVADFDDTVGIPVATEQQAMLPTADGGALWDPLPVTLPTYVTKPKARRTVRTIDLGEPGTWTSGRTVQDARLASQAKPEKAGDSDKGEGQQRALGS